MSETRQDGSWRTIPNPFSIMDRSDIITSHVSGRSTDITDIITGGQSAIILAGAPSIGKSALIRYLQRTPDSEWSWRDELTDMPDTVKPNDVHFVQIDLRPLEGIEQKDRLLSTFVTQCAIALDQALPRDKRSLTFDRDVKGLRELLRTISSETSHARYFVMLDAIERLGWPGIPSFPINTKAQTLQELGIALLDHCNAIHTLVDLIDEFRNFGVIFSIESLPRPRIDDQFTHVSADLARFRTITLQTFTWNDTTKFLAQEPEDFGINWASMFKALGGRGIFSKSEQELLRQQAGTHPYLLQQLCFHMFHLKQEYAYMHGIWTELQESGKDQLIERTNGLLSTFLASIWKRLQEAMDKGRQETKNKFYEFINLLTQKQADEVLESLFWDRLGAELRYILYSEGIVRYDLFQLIHFPGSILRHYLIQKEKENSEQSAPSPTSGRNLTINQPGNQQTTLSLSELEYRLIKTLLQHPNRCTEEELMKGAWGRKIDRPVFTQRMHQLRKKLRERSGETEIIENQYGGFYSLYNPEWLFLE